MDVLQWTDMQQHYDLFSALVASIDDLIKNDLSIRNVYVTGHSLGGAARKVYERAQVRRLQRNYVRGRYVCKAGLQYF